MAVLNADKFGGKNANLINELFTDLLPAAGLWLPGESVLDVTYHEGKWWTEFTPDNFTYRTRVTEPGFDFRSMPEYGRGEFHLVAYDPPYCPVGGRSTTTIKETLDRYGQHDQPATPNELIGMNIAGLTEVLRVAQHVVLLKAMDFVTSKELYPQVSYLEEVAGMLGWAVYDRLVLLPSGGRPQPAGRANLHTILRPSQMTVLVPYRYRRGRDPKRKLNV